MRDPSRVMVVAGCVSLSTMTAAFAFQASAPVAEGKPDAQCQDKPNLTNVAATMSNVFFMEGGQTDTFADDVLMIDFTISVDNAGGVDASDSRVDYSARVLSVGGQVIETFTGVTTLYWTPPGGTEEARVTIMASKLAGLAQPSGEIAGSIAFRAAVDVGDDVDECDETDNEIEMTVDLNVRASSDKSALKNGPTPAHPRAGGDPGL